MARIEKTIEVNAPLSTVYNQWTQFEEFPRFMEGVVQVKQLDDTHLRWRANVAGKEKSWDAEIVEQVPDSRIAWRNTGGARNEGAVEFRRITAERTLVRLTLDYDTEGLVETVGDALGVMSRRVQGDLERFRDFIEWRGRETGQWRGEVHRGRTGGEDARGAHEVPSGMRAASAPSRFGNGPLGWESGQDAFSRLRRMAQEMEVLFDRLMTSGQRRFGGERGDGERFQNEAQAAMQDLWAPHVDVMQEGEELVVSADLPGTRKEDVHVDVEDGRLVIQGERRSHRESGEEGVRRFERTYGQFYREIPLPQGADAEGARATLEDGVLEIRIRVPGRRQGRRLEIHSGGTSSERSEPRELSMQMAGGTGSSAAAGRAPMAGGASGAGSSGSMGSEFESSVSEGESSASEGSESESSEPGLQAPPPRSTDRGGEGAWNLGR